MKKLLLPLTFIFLLMSATTVAQNTRKANDTKTKKVQRKGPKISKNNAVVRINEVPSTPAVVSRSTNRNATRKQRIVETNSVNRSATTKKVSHREMIAKRKRIVDNN